MPRAFLGRTIRTVCAVRSHGKRVVERHLAITDHVSAALDVSPGGCQRSCQPARGAAPAASPVAHGLSRGAGPSRRTHFIRSEFVSPRLLWVCRAPGGGKGANGSVGGCLPNSPTRI